MLSHLAYEHSADLRREAERASFVRAATARRVSRAGRATPTGARRITRAGGRVLAAALRRPACPVGCEA